MSEQLSNNLEAIGIFVGIIIATIIIAYLFDRFFKRMIRHSTLVLRNDPTSYQFLRHTIRFLIYILGFSMAIYAMPNLRAVANSLLAGAGILAVAVGFASQHALSNIISGIFIVLFRPFSVNDRLRVREYNGVVEDITLRHTVIRDFENRRILIPNSVISDEVIINADLNDGRVIKWVEIGISYDSDIDQARAVMLEEIMPHPLRIDGRTKEQIEQGAPEVMIRVLGLGDFSVNLRAYVWAKDQADAFAMGCDLYESIKKRFDKEGIEIPYPHRTLVTKEAGKVR